VKKCCDDRPQHIGVGIHEPPPVCPLPFAVADVFSKRRLARTRHVCASPLSEWVKRVFRLGRHCASSCDRLQTRCGSQLDMRGRAFAKPSRNRETAPSSSLIAFGDSAPEASRVWSWCVGANQVDGLVEDAYLMLFGSARPVPGPVSGPVSGPASGQCLAQCLPWQWRWLCAATLAHTSPTCVKFHGEFFNQRKGAAVWPARSPRNHVARRTFLASGNPHNRIRDGSRR
jgi:hypothetical protein